MELFDSVRGDVEEATQQVSDPFADRPSSKIPAPPKKDPNTKTIASWDEGSDDSMITETINRPKIQPLQREKPTQPSDKDWKSWDEL